MARPRAADDFETIRARMDEIRLERARTLTGQKMGAGVNGVASDEDSRNGERRLPRSVVRKLAR